MQYLKLFVVIIFPGMLFISCDECRYIEYEPATPSGSFRIVGATTGEDLVFGPAKIYDKDQIKFYSLKNTDTTFFNVEWIRWTDSIMLVEFVPITDTVYMRLSNSDVDTLKISWNGVKAKCYGTGIVITNFRLNNSVDIPGNQVPHVIKK